MAKSIMMMAFFFTMPMSRTMPIRAMKENSIPNNRSASNAPMPAEGSVDEDGKGMDEAFVENAENDIDRNDCGQDQKRLAFERALNSAAAP